jgi:hypothetical protein
MEVPPVKAPTKKKTRFFRWIVLILATPILAFILWTMSTLWWSYSTGERAGYVQKFSKRGYVFKTWEGELAMVSMPGTTPEKFLFSVRSDSVAARINTSLGKRVALVYEQHIGVPVSWFAETEYYVTDVRVIDPVPMQVQQ